MMTLIIRRTVKAKGEDGEDLEGVFDNVPLDNSNLIPPDIDEVFDDMPFSPVEEMPPITSQQLSPPTTVTSPRKTANTSSSTTMAVNVDVYVSSGMDFDLYTTPTGPHVSWTRSIFYACH